MIKILYFSSSGGSLPVLTALIEDPEIEVAGVVTKPDKQLGKKIIRNEIATFAQENNIQALTPTSLKNNAQLISEIKEISPDMIVTAHYAFLIPEEILNIPTYALNLHFSLLPAYRGSSPLQWAIALGEEVTGMSIAHMSPRFDDGEIVFQQLHTITATDTAAGLYLQFFSEASQLFPTIIKNVMKGTPSPLLPNPPVIKHPNFYARKLTKEDGRVDWNESDEMIERKIRAFSPWPGVWTTVEELKTQGSDDQGQEKKDARKVKLLQAHMEEETLVIDQLQVEGKKAVGWDDFARGYLNQ